MQYRIEKYNSSYSSQWDSFIAASKNGTFLFHRDFMDYHSSRFQDYSLLVFEEDKLLAVLPAHLADKELHSHGGLTYGGLVYGNSIKLAQVIIIVQAILKYLFDAGITKLYVKQVPVIYHKLPAQEQDYAFFVAGAKLVRKDSLCVYDYAAGPKPAKTRQEAIRRGKNKGLEIVEEDNLQLFWDKILIPNLANKHSAKPVHTIEEITKLYHTFPDNIRHFNVYFQGEIVAGTTVFVTDTVAHPQYVSGNTDKNKLGSLDYLYHYLITEVFNDKRYFDFGPSNMEQGKKLNEGLVFWKESFGARTIVQDFYEIETQNYRQLNDVLF